MVTCMMLVTIDGDLHNSDSIDINTASDYFGNYFGD